MQKNIKTKLFQLFVTLSTFFFITLSYAGAPVWTFAADSFYSPTVSVSSVGFATIKYVITNQSSKTHTLAMQPIAGITQVTTGGNCPNPFTLAYKQSCTLNLLVSGSMLTSNVNGGPVVCQQGSALQCYQPSSANVLNITRTSAVGTLYAGTSSGTVYFSTDSGLTWSAATTPSSGFGVNSIFAISGTLYVGSADDKVYHSFNNGILWTATSAVPDGTAVNAIFVTPVNGVLTIYVGTQGGNVYYSVNGNTWTITTKPGSGSVNSIFITSSNVIYISSGDGNVYYSTDTGNSWNTINGPTTLSGMSIQNVFVANNQLYINARHISSNTTLPPGTVDFEYAYSSNSLTNANPTWTLLSQITYTLFVNADASLIYAGTQDGYVFSLTTGNELGFLTYSPITSLFFLG